MKNNLAKQKSGLMRGKKCEANRFSSHFVMVPRFFDLF